MSSKSSKNRVLVICNGYEMRKGRATKTMQVWRCLKKTCNGSAIFSLQTTTDLEPKNSHSCRKISKRQKIEQLKPTPSKIGVTSGKVVESAKDMLPDDQLLALPSDKALKDIVLRQRKQMVDLENGKLLYFDSLHSDGTKHLNLLKDFLAEFAEERGYATVDPSHWLCLCPKDIPKQKNSFDCGVFVCKFAECFSRKGAMTFSQAHMAVIRNQMLEEIKCWKIVIEIVKVTLLDVNAYSLCRFLLLGVIHEKNFACAAAVAY
uniref:Ubiquitin-like protease family profile domain-containing protein n=1 Tax=Ditylenchus dipsaci TaxID=166011 RepID=A0A915D7I1_9BILA